jgi:hypothetical protein
MSTLMQASNQWMRRPDDERFTSLDDMISHFETVRNESHAVVVPSRRVHAIPTEDNKGMTIIGPDGVPYSPTHWSFGQVAQLAESPAGYLRTLPSPIAADCINYKLQYVRDIEDVGFLLRHNSADTLMAATGPNYGRIWNVDITRKVRERFGDGITSDWRVPGEFGKAVTVTKANTTLYASDRDMFIFLADEKHKIEVPNRRNGESGLMSRGFFLWNSEVGGKTYGMATFLFDYVCCNRIVWGTGEYAEIRVRHTASAPEKYIEEMAPALEAYANGSSSGILKAIGEARNKRLDKVDDFLKERFGARMVQPLKQIHEAEEERPIETLWDVTTAVSAFARSVGHQDARVELEQKAGGVMKLAA